MSKPIPKSLHTVRVVAVIAQDIFDNTCGATSPEECVQAAIELLGYHPKQDSYGLIAKAVAQVGG